MKDVAASGKVLPFWAYTALVDVDRFWGESYGGPLGGHPGGTPWGDPLGGSLGGIPWGVPWVYPGKTHPRHY